MAEGTAAPSPAEPVTNEDPLHCPGCGYDLRGTEADRCSECGRLFDRAALRVSCFPWAHRGEIGHTRAFLATVWLVTISSRTLAHEASKPQDVEQARAFGFGVAFVFFGAVSLISAKIITASMFFVATAPLSGKGPSAWTKPLVACWSAGANLPGVVPVVPILLTACLAKAHLRLFRLRGVSPHHNERAMAIGHYAIAPIVLLMPAVLCDAAWSWIPAGSPSTLAAGSALGIAALILALTAVTGTVVRISQWAMRVRQRQLGYGLRVAIRTVGLWLFCVMVLAVIFPWCLGTLRSMIVHW